jgi:spore germination cell wall hydrolase CwlJ-like protein
MEEIKKIKEERKMTVVNAKQIRAFVQNQKMLCAKELPSEVASQVERGLLTAVKRAEANGRKTIKGCDL